MTAASTLDRPEFTAPTPPSAPGYLTVLLAAAIRSLVTAVSGLLLVLGLALLVWSITPASGAAPETVLRGGVGAFAAGHLMPVRIGGLTLTLAPLLLTAIVGTLLAAGAVRGRIRPTDIIGEVVAAIVSAGVYAAVVVGTAVRFAPTGSVQLSDGWRVAALALTANTVGTLVRGQACRERLTGLVPRWVPVGIRVGTVAAFLLLAGGAIAVIIGLVSSFGTATTLAGLSAPSIGDGLGVALLGLAYIPTAAVAGVGYTTGVGFEIGAGTYSPLASHAVELPALPLLAAAPSSGGFSAAGLALLIVPVLAAAVVAHAVVRRLPTRLERLAAGGVAGAAAAAILVVLALVAAGGVEGSSWARVGVPIGLLAAAVALEIGLLSAVFAGLAGWKSVPWAVDRPTLRTSGAGRGRAGRDADDHIADEPVDVDPADGQAEADGQDIAAGGQDIAAQSQDIADAHTGPSAPATVLQWGSVDHEAEPRSIDPDRLAAALAAQRAVRAGRRP